MKKLFVIIFLSALVLGVLAQKQIADSAVFRSYDIVVDSAQPLAAWQLQVSYPAGGRFHSLALRAVRGPFHIRPITIRAACSGDASFLPHTPSISS